MPNNPVGFTLPYVFEVPGGAAIIDPGWNADVTYESLRDQLAEIGVSFGDIRQIIVTHIHPDHYGLAARVKSESDAEILVHEKDVEFLHWRANHFPNTDIDAWFTGHGMPPVEGGWRSLGVGTRADRWLVAEPADRTIADKETLRLGDFSLEVMWTPGHSPGHACFYEAEKELLLTGDHVLPTISPNVGLWPGTEEDPLGDYLRSLRRLRGLAVRRVLPAHEYDFVDLEARLDGLEAHHEERLQEVIDAMRSGATSGYEVARAIMWSIGHYVGFDMMTRRAAMTETMAHLQHLEREGRIASRREGDKTYYGLRN
ncbi:MAG TPA: MBL fold metallo-hydrolase [Dehalococcoidia bacterium]|nr:MBL fold metallo-hydrolase [Dehalococcoidia bacterium]